MQTTAAIYTDFSHLNDLKRKSRQDSDAALKEVAKQFEAMFIQMVLKQMRQASQGDPIFDNDQSRFYREMHDQQLALHLAEGGSVGIADLIVRQLGNTSIPGRGNQHLANDRHRLVASIQKVESEVKGDRDPVNGTGALNRHDQDVRNGSAKPVHKSSSRFPGLPTHFDSPDQFIRTLLPDARRAASKIGLDPKLLLAQAALETGWGKKIIHYPDGSNSHNLFNIKAGRHWDGGRIQVHTLEYLDGIAVKKRADFRAYDDYRQSFDDYITLLQQPRYHHTLRHTRDPELYIRSLQDAGYATDPHYADKIMAIYRRRTLASL